ncbi:DNA-directed RNA polymerase [Rhodococcus sp. AW25M09]|nr:DNA-directed RNA polymerase [Rhodococcus sp. AW25M09]
MLPSLGPTLKEKDATKWMASLREYLAPGESVRALSRFNTMRPLTDAIAVTDRRVIAFFSASVNKKGPLVEIASSEIGSADSNTKFGGRTLTVHAPGKDPRHVGTMRPDDVSFVVGQVNAIAAATEPEVPTVDVYDPFSKPWEAPSAPDEGPRPQFAAPTPPNHSPQQAFDEPVATEPSYGALDAEIGRKKRLVPLWKSIPVYVISGLFALLVVVAVIDPDAGASIALGMLFVAFIPVLVLTRARHNATKRRAASSGSEPVFGPFERNWLPVGIPVAILLFIVSVALS